VFVSDAELGRGGVTGVCAFTIPKVTPAVIAAATMMRIPTSSLAGFALTTVGRFAVITEGICAVFNSENSKSRYFRL